MATKARLVYGSTIEWGTDGATWAPLPEAKTLAVPEVETDYQEVTSLDSAGGYREYIPGLKDAGELSLECNYTSDLFETALGYQSNRTLVYFRTTLPMETGQTTSGDVIEFTALVSPALQQNEVGEPIALTLNMRTSGEVTFTKGS
jgi:hypothetical protein